MPLTPVEVRHFDGLRRGLFGYKRGPVHRLMDDVADSFETVWRERAELIERLEVLEGELARHAELEGLLRATLVSAERASQETREQARREAEVIVSEANAEARRVLREAISEKERLLGEVRRVRALLRSALEVVEDVPAEPVGETAEAPPQPEPEPEAVTEEQREPGAQQPDADDGDTGSGMHRLVG
jgi:cell division initiation protein